MTKDAFLRVLEHYASRSLDSKEDREALAQALSSHPKPYRGGNSRSDVRSILGALSYCLESASYWISCDAHDKAQEYLETADKHVRALVRLNETP